MEQKKVIPPIRPLGVMLQIAHIQTSLSGLCARINSSFEPLSAMNVVGCIMDAVIDLAKVGSYVDDLKSLNLPEHE